MPKPETIVSDETTTSTNHIERLYIVRGLELLIKGNVRSIAKEIPGSEFVRMRENESEMLNQLAKRFK